MKKFLAISLMLLVTAGLLFAGGTQEKEEKAAEGPVTIRMQSWHLNEYPWRYAWDEFKEAVEAKWPNIKIQWDVSTYGEKEQIFTTQSEARNAADIAHFSYRPVPAFADKGYLLDMTPYIEKEPGLKDKFIKLTLDLATVDGKIYSLPDTFPVMQLAFNRELFEKSGIDPKKPPKTWDEFIEYAKKLTRDLDGDGKLDQWGYGLIGARQEGMFMRLHPWFWGEGGDYLTADGKHSALNTKEALAGFKFYTDLVTKHKVVPPGAVEMGAQEVRTGFAHFKTAMIVGTAWTPPVVDGLAPEFKSAERLEMAAIPASRAGRRPTTSAWIDMRVISAYTKHPDEVWKVYRYIYSEENQKNWFKHMHLPSAQKALRRSKEVMDDKFASVVAMASDTHDVKFEPMIPQLPDIGDAMITAVQETISGIKSAEQALADAHKAVEAVMSR